MEQKKVEQIAAEKYPFDSRKVQSNDDWKVIDATNRAATLQRLGFIDGYNHAQQPQPMWREIDDKTIYTNDIVKDGMGLLKSVWNVWGSELKLYGYTNYLSSDDLLKLPTEKK